MGMLKMLVFTQRQGHKTFAAGQAKRGSICSLRIWQSHFAESTVILEYIEETWPQNPLLPKHTHERALARFWINFGEDSIASITDLFLWTSKDEQERAIAITKAQETLRVIEEQGLGDYKFFGGNNIGMVDIIYGCHSHWLEGLEEIAGMKLIEPNKFPRLMHELKILNKFL
ncbi:hypothetical protein RIF29_23051 [Crotalaria pallida]|uniref:Glutathione S-transferase n=1 Tax=Crotalaria pallida TaxID=3830 RepID=A0AAN9IAR2_CROPI